MEKLYIYISEFTMKKLTRITNQIYCEENVDDQCYHTYIFSLKHYRYNLTKNNSFITLQHFISAS